MRHFLFLFTLFIRFNFYSCYPYYLTIHVNNSDLPFDHHGTWTVLQSTTVADDSPAGNTGLFQSIQLPFSFRYFETNYSTIYVDPNGNIWFKQTPPCVINGVYYYSDPNGCGLNSNAYTNLISPSTTDYYNDPNIPGIVASGSRISYFATSTFVSVTFYKSTMFYLGFYNNNPQACNLSVSSTESDISVIQNSFSVTLYNTGDIVFNYINISDPRSTTCYNILRIWMVGLRPPSFINLPAYFKTSFYSTTMTGIYPLVKSNAGIKFCPINSEICVSPIVSGWILVTLNSTCDVNWWCNLDGILFKSIPGVNGIACNVSVSIFSQFSLMYESSAGSFVSLPGFPVSLNVVSGNWNATTDINDALNILILCQGYCPKIEKMCQRDCYRVPFGTAVVDSCGVCAGGLTGIAINSSRNCFGICFGSGSVSPLAIPSSACLLSSNNLDFNCTGSNCLLSNAETYIPALMFALPNDTCIDRNLSCRFHFLQNRRIFADNSSSYSLFSSLSYQSLDASIGNFTINRALFSDGEFIFSIDVPTDRVGDIWKCMMPPPFGYINFTSSVMYITIPELILMEPLRVNYTVISSSLITKISLWNNTVWPSNMKQQWCSKCSTSLGISYCGTQDCSGNFGGDLIFDDCNICGGNNMHKDCTGECFAPFSNSSQDIDVCAVFSVHRRVAFTFKRNICALNLTIECIISNSSIIVPAFYNSDSGLFYCNTFEFVDSDMISLEVVIRNRVSRLKPSYFTLIKSNSTELQSLCTTCNNFMLDFSSFCGIRDCEGIWKGNSLHDSCGKCFISDINTPNIPFQIFNETAFGLDNVTNSLIWNNFYRVPSSDFADCAGICFGSNRILNRTCGCQNKFLDSCFPSRSDIDTALAYLNRGVDSYPLLHYRLRDFVIMQKNLGGLIYFNGSNSILNTNLSGYPWYLTSSFVGTVSFSESSSIKVMLFDKNSPSILSIPQFFTVVLPFNFPWYGQYVSTIYISSNGAIHIYGFPSTVSSSPYFNSPCSPGVDFNSFGKVWGCSLDSPVYDHIIAALMMDFDITGPDRQANTSLSYIIFSTTDNYGTAIEGVRINFSNMPLRRNISCFPYSPYSCDNDNFSQPVVTFSALIYSNGRVYFEYENINLALDRLKTNGFVGLRGSISNSYSPLPAHDMPIDPVLHIFTAASKNQIPLPSTPTSKQRYSIYPMPSLIDWVSISMSRYSFLMYGKQIVNFGWVSSDAGVLPYRSLIQSNSSTIFCPIGIDICMTPIWGPSLGGFPVYFYFSGARCSDVIRFKCRFGNSIIVDAVSSSERLVCYTPKSMENSTVVSVQLIGDGRIVKSTNSLSYQYTPLEMISEDDLVLLRNPSKSFLCQSCETKATLVSFPFENSTSMYFNAVCPRDCSGQYFGSHVLDRCGLCETPANLTGSTWNSFQIDCMGICNGPFIFSNFGSCICSPTRSDCILYVSQTEDASYGYLAVYQIIISVLLVSMIFLISIKSL